MRGDRWRCFPSGHFERLCFIDRLPPNALLANLAQGRVRRVLELLSNV